MTGRAKRSVLAYVTDIGGLTVLTVAGFVTTPIILHLTSAALYGFWIIVLSILSYLALTDFGLGVSLIRIVAGLTSGKDAGVLNRVISTAFVTYCAAGLLFFGLGIGLSPFIANWFKIPQADVAQVVTAYQVALFASAIFLPLSTFAGVVIGFQRMALTNTLGNLIRLISIGLSIALLYSGFGLVSLALSALFTVVVDSLVNYFYARRLFPQLRIRPSLVNRTDFVQLVSFGVYFQGGRIANTVALSTDSIVISAKMGVAQVAPYAFMSKLAVLFSTTIASKLPTAVFPALSQMFAAQEKGKIQRIFIRLAWYSVRMAVVAGVFLAVTNRQFVSLWVGPQYYRGPVLNTVFVFWVLQDTLYRGTLAIVYASGDLRDWAVVSIAEAVINLTTSLLLVGPLGLVGVALGTSIGKTLTTAWYIPYWICRKTDLPVLTFLYKGILYPALRSLPGVILVILSAILFPQNWGWLWIVLVGLVSVGGNLIFFEVIHLFRPSNESWSNRLRQLFDLPKD